MKLNKLYRKSDREVLSEYVNKLQKYALRYEPRLLNEAKITITIDDKGEEQATAAPPAPQIVHHHHGGGAGIPEDKKVKFIDGAKKLGKFSDSEWVEQLLRGMEQAGVQGARARFNEIKEDESPVSRSEVKQLIGLLLDLFSN